jgi:SAM-dependent methyltransferase
MRGARRPLVLLAAAAAAAAAAAVVRHGRGHTGGRRVAGGTLIGDTAGYDTLSRLLGPFYRGIAADVAAVAPDGARVLEVGCGPGQLSLRLAGHGLQVTGVDLDPAMVGRARANAGRRGDDGRPRPSFLVGDAAALAFPDGAFDLVVSTLSLHHWADPAAGLAEIGRVLRPGGRALVWDLRPGARPHLFGPRHAHLPDPADHLGGAPLRLVAATPWPWPWRLTLTQRVELARDR